MKCRSLIAAAVLFVGVAYSSNMAYAGCATAAADKDKKEAGEMDPAMMEAWMKSMTPGAPHKHMEYFAGDWAASNTMWMGGQETKSTGTMHAESSMGGRYLVSSHKGMINGMPFEGMGIDGYDNVNGELYSLWFDNMGTGYMLSKGTSSEDMKKCTYIGSTKDPMTGKMVSHKMVTTITGPDTYKFEMWMTPAGAKEDKMMEINYTRVKKS